ncbi:MAG: hypothetical protein VKJ85_08830 [Prochlorothrix sp.]|nr:hypothetical protein [Prochlorothrix sp.]
MKRNDRKTSSDDNAVNHLRSQQAEPIPPGEYKQRYLAARATVKERDEKLQRVSAALVTTQEQFAVVQQQYEVVQNEIVVWQGKVQENEQLYRAEQARYQETLGLYNQERDRANSLLAQYEAADAERAQYLVLYEDTLAELEFEKRSKAGIKGWETRRKRENERLKQEIAELAILLRDSLDRKEEAIANLETMASRMDRIQNLVNSVESGTKEGQANLLEKLRRIWVSIKEILAE